jgi:hypothetical protein
LQSSRVKAGELISKEIAANQLKRGEFENHRQRQLQNLQSVQQSLEVKKKRKLPRTTKTVCQSSAEQSTFKR